MSEASEDKPTESDWAELRRQKEIDLGTAPLTPLERGRFRLMVEESERRKWLWKKTRAWTAWLAGLLASTTTVVQILQGWGHK